MKSQDRRAQIVRGMRSAIAERGYAGASVQVIARAAGVTPGLLHYHFTSKEEVLVALVLEMKEHLRARFLARAAGDPRARLMAWIDALTEDTGEDSVERVRCWVVVGAEAVFRPEVRAVYGQAIAQVLAALEEELRAIIGARAPEAAAALLAAVEGYFHLAAACGGVIPPGSARVALRAMASGLIGETP